MTLTLIKTVYSTNGMDEGSWAARPNESDCAVAVGGPGSDGRYSINVIGPYGAAYALVSRDELRLLCTALTRELGPLN